MYIPLALYRPITVVGSFHIALLLQSHLVNQCLPASPLVAGKLPCFCAAAAAVVVVVVVVATVVNASSVVVDVAVAPVVAVAVVVRRCLANFTLVLLSLYHLVIRPASYHLRQSVRTRLPGQCLSRVATDL